MGTHDRFLSPTRWIGLYSPAPSTLNENSMDSPAPETEARTGTLRKMPVGIWVLGLVSLLMDVSSELIHSLLPVFMVSVVGASALTIGIIEGVAEASALIVKIFSGTLSDYLGRRKTLTAVGYGLSALSKPLFALATTSGAVMAARLIDRFGKGIRGAPRDALVADFAPPGMRGAAFGLRQALDTVGAFLGPLLGMGLMLLWANDFHSVFLVAIVPAFLSVGLLLIGIREPQSPQQGAPRTSPLRLENLRRLSGAYWGVVVLATLFSMARFSEAFLVMRAQQGGLPIAYAPLVLILMNAVYALAAYPFGKLADSLSRLRLLVLGTLVLFAAQIALALDNHGVLLWSGLVLWGLHMALTQGLLSAMVAETAPADLRGTAFGFFNLMSGLSMLFASAVAGLLWDAYGASMTFLGGMAFSGFTLLALLLRGGDRTDDVPC